MGPERPTPDTSARKPHGAARTPAPRATLARVTAQILDGKATAATIKNELRERVAKLREAGVVPGLGTVLVGDDPGSVWYVAGKHRDCAQVASRRSASTCRPTPARRRWRTRSTR
jgi:hypothetical protein